MRAAQNRFANSSAPMPAAAAWDSACSDDMASLINLKDFQSTAQNSESSPSSSFERHAIIPYSLTRSVLSYSPSCVRHRYEHDVADPANLLHLEAHVRVLLVEP
eukprot:2252547-Pyramimonas_sp.AAC.1